MTDSQHEVERLQEKVGERELRDFDICQCGDYRRDHFNGVGPCLHNQPMDLSHGYKDCVQFRFSRAAAAIPDAYRSALLNDINRKTTPEGK